MEKSDGQEVRGVVKKKRAAFLLRFKKREISNLSNNVKKILGEKFFWGALVIEMMKKGELDEKKILKRLDTYLTKDIDRKLFTLPEKNQENVDSSIG